jgi:N-acetylmuramic acid 6-phosphate etherase
MDAPIVDSPTESRNPRTRDIDLLPTAALVEAINAEDAMVASAVAKTVGQIARAVDLTVDRINRGGRVHYFGAGTPARIAALDAAELLPTFNAPPGLVTAHPAGGPAALSGVVEDAEDDEDSGRRAAEALTADDVAFGITASGRTPYVGGALAAAQQTGALTIVLTANPQSELGRLAEIVIAPATGPEVIAGSTRMKAGTAQKLVLNAYSTAVMIRLGRTWSNLMVSLVATNGKLRGRSLRILVEATGETVDVCRAALDSADGDVKVALVALLRGVGAAEAAERLGRVGGAVRAAVADRT